jgi:hypothetical protein
MMAALFSLLNFSVWRKVRADPPYLTKPVEDPPPPHRMLLPRQLSRAGRPWKRISR